MQSISATASAATATECDREPIHTPGSVQPNGVLLVLRESDNTIAQVSQNIERVFGKRANEVLGKPLADFLPKQTFDAIITTASTKAIEGNPLYVTTFEARTSPVTFYHVIMHRHLGAIIIEFYSTHDNGSISFQNLYELMRTSLLRLENAKTLQDLWHFAAEEMRRTTGFDRVMIYKFDEQWNGEVVAEDRAPELDSWVGLRYPAA